ncbi:N-acetylmuramoyl-L-alanine amidase, family 2 (fragment) [Candidatus Sulfopaludibacter sp. SbA4]
MRGKRAYHYVIDRFGRVHRIVAESDAANHAGNSVWADSRWLYLDLNASFLGVAFEASMQTGQPPLTQAQIHAARVLTEMLRSKYNLAAENCVTHAQVSVNPENMHIGWHADWGKDFPFREIGLPENYEQPLPSLYLFGFVYDPVYRSVTGPAIWRSLAASEKLVEGAADQRRMAAGEYRALLRKRYRDLAAALKQRNADDEN